MAYGTSGDGTSDVGGCWTMIGGGNGSIKYSYDGISWSDSVGGNSFSSYGIRNVAYGTSGDGTPMWVAVGQDQ